MLPSLARNASYGTVRVAARSQHLRDISAILDVNAARDVGDQALVVGCGVGWLDASNEGSGSGMGDSCGPRGN